MRFRVLVLVVVGVLVAAACGGGDDDEATGEEATGAPTVESTPNATAEPTPEPTDEPRSEPTEEATPEPAEEATPEPEPLYHDLLEVGDCFDDPADGYEDIEIVIEPVDCAEVHDNEIFGDGTYADGDAYPGEDVLEEFAFDSVCDPAYAEFMGLDPGAETVAYLALEETVPYFALQPDETVWEQGDRRIICAVYDDAGAIGTAASAGLPLDNVILFHVSNVDGQVDLWVTGGAPEPERITNDPEEEVPNPPTLDPNGRYIWYARYPAGDTTEADIWRYDVETDQIEPVLATFDDENNPQVSPDGTKLLYQSDAAGDYDVWVMDVDGTNNTLLTEQTGRDGNAMWSPDGSRIVYSATVDGNSDIWIMNADGSDKRRLTDDPGGDYDPVFHPSGDQIAFSSDRTGDFEVWLMEADGSNQVNLTNHPAADEYPSWLGDGGGIAFTSDRIGRQIWIMRSDGSDQTLATDVGLSGYAFAGGFID